MSKPPRRPPEKLISEYTMGHTIPIRWNYIDNSVSKPYRYSSSLIDTFLDDARKRRTKYYGMTDLWLHSALDKLSLEKKTVLIIGSVQPWYEAIVLERGGKPTVLEYNKIECADKRIPYLQPHQMKGRTFDIILSISSFEHDGLGRYGDPLNPDGDIQSMQKMKTYLKENGRLILAVPVGNDSLIWNMGRMYGRRRLPQLMRGWKIEDTRGLIPSFIHKERGLYAEYQPIWILSRNQKNTPPLLPQRTSYSRIKYVKDIIITVLRRPNPLKIIMRRLFSALHS